MKIIETLTDDDFISMLDNNDVVSFFGWMRELSFASMLPNMGVEYFINRSGSKTISPFYENLINKKTLIEGLIPERIIANTLLTKFGSKWERIYNVLFTTDYNVLEEKSYSTEKNGNTDDSVTYDTEVQNNRNFNRKESVTNTENSNDDTYGFNSVNSVPTSKTEATSTNITESKSADNTDNNMETKTGVDRTVGTYGESITNNGREHSPAMLIENEIKLRNENIFFDIVLSDIDSIVALAIYL